MIREAWLNAALAATLLAVPLWAWAAGETYTVTLATRVAILALAGVGLNLALGQGGLISFGHAAFFGVGGYAMGILASHAQDFRPLLAAPVLIEGTQSMPVIWLTAIIAGALAALVIGALSLRTTGAYFIMITLAFAQMFYYAAISSPAYGGEDGLPIYVRNNFPGLNTLDPIQFFGLAYGALLAGLALSAWLRATPFGWALAAARQSPDRAQAMGLQPYRLRLVAFTISGSLTALAGALFADLNRFVSPSMFAWSTSGEIMILVILGGIGRLFGPVAGAGLFILLEHWLGGVWDHWLMLVGAVLLGTILFARGGLVGTLAKGPPHG